LGFYAGWTCFQNESGGSLPVWNEAKDVCLIFSGEHHSEQADIDGLRARGHQFDGDDLSWLVHWYEELGPGFLRRLNGWFSGLLLDLRDSTVTLFNDRYGVNRIYYYQNADAFYFSSEAKALLKVLPELHNLDPAGLAEFLSCGCVLQDRTLFRSVSLLPGGSAWRFSPGHSVRKDLYFKRESWEDLPGLSNAEYYEKLRETWTRILPRYLKGRERAALSLTGGVDSRMILACASHEPGTLPCYTFGGMYRDCLDLTVSRRVAEICEQPHETLRLDKRFLGEFPALMEKTAYISDGCMDPTGSADLYVQRLAREIAPVRVSGLNGGEILRRLVAFKPMPLATRLFTPELELHARAAAVSYSNELRGHKLSFIAFKQAAWHLHPRLSIERSQLTLRSPYFDNDLIPLAYQAPPAARNAEPALRLIAESKPALGRVATDRAVLLRGIPGLTAARHLCQELTFRAEYAFDYGMPQWLARVEHAFAAFHFEKVVLGRHKFYHFRVWYRDELSTYLREVLLDPRARSRPYLNGAALEEVVMRHTNGRGNYTTELHRLLTLELAQRQLLDRT
jgi:asparagine synthase (glutamine-hydrolysing)